MCLKTFVQDNLNYDFKEEQLLKEALVTSGVVSGADSIIERQGNRRLALIGDALIRLELVHTKYLEGAKLATSQKCVSKNASNQNLGTIGQQNGLVDQMVLPASQRKPTTYTVATTVEALIGAIWLDSEQDFNLIGRVIRALHIESA
ncbi:putative rnase iii protein [Botrytis fragariae]|uniref:Putative rnase iii protein n=1 Tax=Botrytis fragariae TaxID=1964551 RepID=A0A8H6ANZ6_9HELO|nr:putative rnase iii protein [Botrytis fragariae]KAF5871136.1 putative rnase iii protein [Botrytis fragariae]